MNTQKTWGRRHPVVTYLVLTFAISWGLVLLVIGGLGAIPADAQELDALLPLVVLSLEVGPVAAALLLTGWFYGKDGFRELLARLLTWHVGVRWYAVALLTAPVLALVTLLPLSLASAAFVPGVVSAADKAGLLVQALLVFLLAGLFEEPGWTGFAVPHLRRHHGVFGTGLVVGLAWGGWHMIAAVWGSGTTTGAFSPSLFLAQFAYYLAVLTAYRILMVWVYDHTQSLLVAMLMHGSLSASVLYVFVPLEAAPSTLLVWYLALAGVLWVLVAAVITASKSQRSHRVPTNWVAPKR